MPLEYFLPLDKTATATTNRMLGEEHAVNSDAETVFVLTRGAFFTKDLELYSLSLNRPLLPNVDFVAVHLYSQLTAKFGLEVMCAISIINPDVRGSITVNYRAVGGPYLNLVEPLHALIQTLTEDTRPVTWGNIIGIPDQFIPAEHLHSIYDSYGYEYMVEAMNAVKDALISGSQTAVTEVKIAFDHMMEYFITEVDTMRSLINGHIGDTGNVHLITRQQLAIEKVPNTGWASDEQALAGTPGHFMSPSTSYLISNKVSSDTMNAHMNATNPHGITATFLGLGNVQNFGVATITEVENGASNKYVVASILKQYVEGKFNGYLDDVWDSINTHHSAHNPHGITKATIGLDKVNNFATATNEQGIAGLATNLYMTPAATAAAIASQSAVKSVQGRTGHVTLNASDRTALGLAETHQVTFNSVIAKASAAANTPYTRMIGESGNRLGFQGRGSDGVVRDMLLPNGGLGRQRLLSTDYLIRPAVYTSVKYVPGGNNGVSLSFDEASFFRVFATSSGTMTVSLTKGQHDSKITQMLDSTDVSVNHASSMTVFINPGPQTVRWSNVNWGEAGAPDLSSGWHYIVFTIHTHSNVINGVYIGGGFS